MPDLLPELITDVFTRLPVESLLRFRSLSKQFHALIDSPAFIKLHLNQSLKSNSHRSIVKSNFKDKPIGVDFIDKEILRNYQPENYRIHVVGSCNGLVCLSLGTDVVLWNPSTRDRMHLPASLIEFTSDSVSVEKFVYGFGYDHVNDDYKVLRIVEFMSSDRHEVKVYSLKLNSWQRLKDLPREVWFGRVEGVLVNGAYHWALTRDFFGRTPQDWEIISFDLATERFILVPHPQYTNFVKRLILCVGELGRRLSLTFSYYQGTESRSDTWVMNTYGREESWTKLFTVGQSLNIRQLQYLNAITYSKDKEQVLLEQGGGDVVWYDFKPSDVKDIKSPGYPMYFVDACICTGSLVKLPAEARTGVATGKPEKKRQTTVVRRTDDDMIDNFWRVNEKRRKS